MGLTLASLRFLAREHRRKAFRGAVLTLGRQGVYATPEQAAAVLQKEGVDCRPLPPEVPLRSNIPAWRGTPYEQFISDAAFFTWLGADSVRALDYSNFEGAELLADLNQPLATELRGQFDLVVDAGTLEHIFHVPQALANIGTLLKPGGRVVHITPANNFTNHGFYQICPTLYADYYRTNGYVDVQCFLAEHRTQRIEFAPVSYYRLEPGRQPCLMLSPRMLQSICIAEKTPTSTVDRIPIQSYYADLYRAERGEGAPDDSLAGRLKSFLPSSVKHFIRRHILRLHDHHRPWRLQRWARF